jgi:hypothetical protein
LSICQTCCIMRDTPRVLASVHHELEQISILLIYLESKPFHEPSFQSLEQKKGGVISDSPFMISLGAEPRIDISSSNCHLSTVHHPRLCHCV